MPSFPLQKLGSATACTHYAGDVVYSIICTAYTVYRKKIPCLFCLQFDHITHGSPRVHTPNDILISSPGFAGLAVVTNRQTDRLLTTLLRL